MNNAAFLAADLRGALRRFRSTPGQAAIVLLVFALGLGATTAVFALVHAELLRPLPYADPGRLVSLAESAPAEHNDRYEVSLPNLQDWQAADPDFESLAYYTGDEVTYSTGDRARRLQTAEVSPDFFRTLGVAPEIGTELPRGAAAAGSVVVSHRFWRESLGGRREALGSALRIGGKARTIVGVMPASFDFPSGDTDLWTPFAAESWMRNRSVHILHAVARLKRGVTVGRASADLAGIAAAVQRRVPGADPGHGAAARSLREAIVGPARPGLLAFAGAVGLVWLIACADLASIMLTRAERRRREVGIRRALGAGTVRLAVGMAVEGAWTGALGGAAAFTAFAASTHALTALVPSGLPRAAAIAEGSFPLLFSLAAGLLSGILLGLVPAPLLLAAPRSLLGASGPVASRSRRALVDAIVVAQTGLCLALLTAAGLLSRSFVRLTAVDPGFRGQRLLTMTLDLGETGWTSRAALRAFAPELERKVGAVPGVASVSATSRLPISGGDPNGSLTVEGRSDAGAPPPASFRRVLPGYFRTMGIPVRRGRDFDDRDAGSPMVVIVNASLADRYWPGADPIGRRIKVGPAEREPWLTVIGVAGDVLNTGLADDARLATYEPFVQRPTETLTLVARIGDRDEGIAASVARAVREVNPRIAIYDVAWMTDRIRESLSPRRTYTIATGFFAGTTLLLAAIGLFGLLSSAVASRTREIGVRMAVGARASDIRRLILRWGGSRLAAGIALGVPASLAAAEVLARRVPGALFGVSATDRATFLSVIGLLGIVGLAAALLPARRAARVDPVQALRNE